VLVAKVRTCLVTCPSGEVSKTHATTVFLWTSNPQQRSKRTCIASLVLSTGVGESNKWCGIQHKFPVRARSEEWQQSSLLDAPGSASTSGSRHQKRSTSPRYFRCHSRPFSSASLARRGIVLQGAVDIVRNKNAKNVLLAHGQMATGRAIEMRIPGNGAKSWLGGAFATRFAWDGVERRTSAPDSSDLGGCQLAPARRNRYHRCLTADTHSL